MFQELLTSFGAIEEPRQVGKVDHLLIDVLAITVCAVLAHAETFEDIALYGKHKEKWLRQFLELPNGIPSHDTFRRVFMLVEAERFDWHCQVDLMGRRNVCRFGLCGHLGSIVVPQIESV